MKKVTILLSSYNGEKYIEQQIKSILNQTYENIHLLIRDDGSIDSTVKIIEKYNHGANNIELIKGENIGCTKSFWELLKNAPKSDFYAFADQDDFWLEDKIETAITCLEQENINMPLLYCTDTIVVDESLNIISKSNICNKFILDFKESLIKAVSPGCTFVFNHNAHSILSRYNIRNCDIHDWVAHRIISCFGKVIYCTNPKIMYRQHGNNLIGIQKKGLINFVKKIKRVNSNKGLRSGFAKDLLKQFENEISGENKELLIRFSTYIKFKNVKKGLITEYKTIYSGKIFFLLKFMFKWNIV